MSKSKSLDIDAYAHIYNRGVDKRAIVGDIDDLIRFLKTIQEINTIKPIGSIRDKPRGSTSVNEPLVIFIAYCVNYNHFHFVLRQCTEGGIQRFMHRFATAYTMYFNEKYHRSGALFQGRYKCVPIETDEQLLHICAYTNKNDLAHGDKNPTWFSRVPFSSLGEYISVSITNPICDTSIVLEKYKSKQQYERHLDEVVSQIIKRKTLQKELQMLLIE